MRLVLIAYNEALDGEVLDLVRSAGATGCTKWTKVLGEGRASGPHLASHVWPKANNVLAVCAEPEAASALMDGVRKLRESLGAEGVKAFLLPVEEVT